MPQRQTRGKGRADDTPPGSVASSGAPVFQIDQDSLSRLMTAARGEPRVSQGDPFARRCKDFKDLGGTSFDGLGGVQKALD